MTLNREKLGHIVTSVKYLAGVFSLIFFPKALIWNKTTFEILSSINSAELVKNEPMIPFSIQFIAAYWNDFKSL